MWGKLYETNNGTAPWSSPGQFCMEDRWRSCQEGGPITPYPFTSISLSLWRVHQPCIRPTATDTPIRYSTLKQPYQCHSSHTAVDFCYWTCLHSCLQYIVACPGHCDTGALAEGHLEKISITLTSPLLAWKGTERARKQSENIGKTLKTLKRPVRTWNESGSASILKHGIGPRWTLTKILECGPCGLVL